MSIQLAEELNKNDTLTVPMAERDRSFRLAHAHGRKSFFFCAPTKEEAVTWVNKLTLASNADLSGTTSPQNEVDEILVINQP